MNNPIKQNDRDIHVPSELVPKTSKYLERKKHKFP